MKLNAQVFTPTWVLALFLALIGDESLKVGAVICEGSEIGMPADDASLRGRVVFEYGGGTFASPRAERRILDYLAEFSEGQLEVIKDGQRRDCDEQVESPVVLHLSLGLPSFCPGEELGPDAYRLCGGRRTVELEKQVYQDVPYVSGVGGASMLTKSARGASTCPRGTLYAAYALLEHLGFAFLKTFQPVKASLSVFLSSNNWAELDLKPFTTTHKPKLSIRQWHYHTQHPLELVDVLQGWGKDGYADSAGFQEMLPQVEALVEWLIANQQNRFQYALLAAESWKTFARSPLRASRLRQLTEIAHCYCLAIGVDAPIVFVQQHAFPLLPTLSGTAETQRKMIQQSIDYLADTGIDFLGTESGLSEFHKPSCTDMLRWMNETACYAQDTYNLTVSIKVHCSTAQVCPEFNDLNFNFLPERASPRMGVSPHTVQFYTLDDPAPGVYGNSNFTYMKKWMFKIMQAGDREVLYYPETAYWCSFDSSVPLFLPLYARARFLDLRSIERFQLRTSTTLAGQSNFDSGFEWGAWFNSVITARSAFDHGKLEEDDEKAFTRQITRLISRHIMKTGADATIFAASLAKIVESQYETMVIGNRTVCQGRLANCTAISYISGYNMYTDISRKSSQLTVSVTRIPLSRVWRVKEAQFFRDTVKPVILRLLQTLVREHEHLQGSANRVRPEAAFLYKDILDSIEITALRTRQVMALYTYVIDGDAIYMKQSEEAISKATSVVLRRRANYGVSEFQVDSWSANPTVYRYRYLWTVKTLYYWLRDQALAQKVHRGDVYISPCFRNVENALQELNQFSGIDYVDFFMQVLRDTFHNVPLVNLITDCLNAPVNEPVFS